jgi:F-type H+-transporting ATPase subunit delta
MAELATIARPYAEALFKAVTAGAGVDLGSTAAWLDELAAIAANPQLAPAGGQPQGDGRPGV